MRRLLRLALVGLVACGGGGGDGGFGGSTPSVILPVAIAGDDFEALVLSPVTLSAVLSHDPAGGALTYQWAQTGGTAVTLSDPTAVMPTFTAPGSTGTLAFLLTVTGANGTDSDEVAVAIKTMIVSAPDKWFVGYGRSDSVTATVSGGTGPFTYEWTGIDSWLTVTGGTAGATLSFTTPLLTDFQNFPDRAEAAMIEKTTQGREQFKIKVTDALGAVDEELVNMSAGPFAATSIHENVALGEPLFLNGGATNGATITAWSWSLTTAPVGAVVAFTKPDKIPLGAATTERFIYFVPNKVGDYEIVVSQTSAAGTTPKVITITCGTWVGVGGITGATPDPFKGECAACHAGQLSWVADFANPWKQTGHARMYEEILDPASPYYAASQAKGHWNDAFNFGSSYSIDSRNVGWSAITSVANNGWVKPAYDERYVFTGTTWEDLKRKHPRTAAKSNVQCESCHGPGSEHAGDTTGIRKSYDANLCGRCHSRKQDLWEASSHGKPPIASPSGSASCNGCHTAQGFIVEMRAQEGADPHTVLFAVSNINRPVIPAEDRRGTTCQACHEPHKKTAKRGGTGMDPQLRAYGNVKFMNGAVANAGEAAVCYMCHQSRTDTTPGSTFMNIRRAPHDSTAAEMLSTTNGQHYSGWTYSASPHGIANKFVTPSKGENRQCLACHVDVQPAKGQTGYNAIGGHTFAMKQGSGTVIADPTTHTGATTSAGSKVFAVASGPSFLKKIYTGDTILLDGVPYTVASVDTARKLTLSAAATGAVTTWSITSTLKYNSASCVQCHTVAPDFRVLARGDYDGDGTVEVVQDEIDGLLAKLLAAIDAKLVALIGSGTTASIGSRVRYNKLGSGTLRTFPGPGVPTSENPDIAWASLTSAQQDEWWALYQAAYNHTFVKNDKSHGIHNTGYAVNLLQSAYKAVTGSSAGAPFAPFP